MLESFFEMEIFKGKVLLNRINVGKYGCNVTVSPFLSGPVSITYSTFLSKYFHNDNYYFHFMAFPPLKYLD